jgi:hypothetical protein
VLSGLHCALIALALLAGVTGTWSPCGLSTIETLCVGGVHRGGRVLSLATSLAFGLGALVGAIVTFGLLALLGALLHTGVGGLGAAVAVAIAVAAALLEATGTRVFPQVRRQVPEPWRRRMPIGLAAGLYGVLLGLGFTTFVMSFAVWALAGIALALGSPQVGLLVGLGFGAGRALPVVALAPIADLRSGRRVLDSMTGRAGLLRGLRLADALALALCASLLAAPAGAVGMYLGRTDPSVATEPGQLAWQEPGVGGFVALAGHTSRLPGDDPALGGKLIAWRVPGAIELANRLTLTPLRLIPAPGADLLAVSDRWLVYRVPPSSADEQYALFATRLEPPGQPVRVAVAKGASQLGRPALDGDTLVFHLATPHKSEIIAIDLAAGRTRVLRAASFAQLLNPSLLGRRLLYVRVDECRQQLLLGPAVAGTGRGDRVLASRPTDVPRDGGYEPGAIREGRTPHHCIGPRSGAHGGVVSYWTTALARFTAFLTVLESRDGRSTARVVRMRRH